MLTEPTSGAIWNAQVGVLWFSVRVAGRPAHAGEAASGHNAIEAMVPVIAALRGLEAELNAAPARPRSPRTRTRSTSTSARSAAATGRRRSRASAWPRCASRSSRASGSRTCAPASRRPSPTAARADAFLQRCTVEVRYDGFACEGYVLDADPGHRRGRRGRGAGHRRRPGAFASTATTDARTFHLHGATPAICFGPHAENIHSVDERVHLPSIVTTAQTLALFVRDWCG